MKRKDFLEFGVIILLFIFIFEVESRAHHHKVHNLALFPERHSWCQTQPIRQEISAHNPDCQPLTIDNIVCLGACFSYSVPRAQDDSVIPPYCDACRPIKSSWTTVVLNCTKGDTQERYHVLRNVELIANCSCVDCSGHSSSHSSQQRTDVEESSGDSNDSGETETSSKEAARVGSSDLDEEDGDEDEVIDLHHFPGIDLPTLHKLKSASAELKGIPKAAEDLMIKDNKITPDDDDLRHDTRHN